MPVPVVDLPASEHFRDAFAAADATQPVVLWRPTERDCRPPLIRRFALFCERLRDSEGLISANRFADADLSDFEDNLAVFEPSSDGIDFRFLHFGSDLQATRGRDLTGRTTAALDPHLRKFLNALIAATLRSGFPVLSIHEPVPMVFATDRIGITFPLADAYGRHVQAARVTVNQNPLVPGLDALPDPALVIQTDRRVVFANSQAVALFGARAFTAETVNLHDYCGFEIDLKTDGGTDMELLRQFRTRMVQNGVIVTAVVTLRKVFFREMPFLIVIIRPD